MKTVDGVAVRGRVHSSSSKTAAATVKYECIFRSVVRVYRVCPREGGVEDGHSRVHA